MAEVGEHFSLLSLSLSLLSLSQYLVKIRDNGFLNIILGEKMEKMIHPRQVLILHTKESKDGILFGLDRAAKSVVSSSQEDTLVTVLGSRSP